MKCFANTRARSTKPEAINPRDPPNCRCNMMQHVQRRPSTQSTSFRNPILLSFYVVHAFQPPWRRPATPSNCNFARAGSPDAGNLGLLRLSVLRQPAVPAKVHTLQRSPTLRRVTFEWCKHCRHCRQKNRLHQTGQQSPLPGCPRVVRTGLLSFGTGTFMSLGWSLLLRFRACFLSTDWVRCVRLPCGRRCTCHHFFVSTARSRSELRAGSKTFT